MTRVIVFTMEKVGSSTVKWALEHAGYSVDRAYAGNAQSIDWSYDVITPAKDLIKYKRKVITLVRDWIARDISYAFENGFTNVDFKHHMMKEVNMTVTGWFDRIVPHFTGVKVYDSEFNKQRGWQIYNNKLLVIRTEDLTAKLDEALTAFLGENNYVIEHRAKGAERFGSRYAKLLKETTFPPEFLDGRYTSKYTTHFYTEKEIEGFRNKWTG